MNGAPFVTTETVDTSLPLGQPENVAENITAAVELNERGDELIARAVEAGVSDVYLIGCGGSLMSLGSPHRLLAANLDRPVYRVNASEFTHSLPKRLGEDSLVIASSTRGETKETAHAATVAREAGATVIGVTQDAGSIVGEAVEHNLVHQGQEAKSVLLGQLAWSLLKHTGADADHAGARTAFAALSEALPAVYAEMVPLSTEIADRFHEEPVVYVLGSGPQTDPALTLSLCYLQEMQWKHAAAFNANEFLHGAFEAVDDDTAVVLFVGEDSSRPIAERTGVFLKKYAKKTITVDSREQFALAGVPENLRPLFAEYAFYGGVTTSIANHFAARTGHPLATRRYMWTVEY